MSISARTSKPASCWPRSTRPNSTSSCCRHGRSGQSAQANARAGGHHGQTLAGAARHRLRRPAGRRPTHRRLHRQAAHWRSAAQANVDRLVATKGFRAHRRAFDGVVTARDTDVGALINRGQRRYRAGAVRGVRRAASCASTCRCRRAIAPSITHGIDRHAHRAGISGPHFHRPRRCVRADSVNASFGHARWCSLLVDNADGKLMPGSFASVHFNLPATASAARSGQRTDFRRRGMHVATVERVTTRGASSRSRILRDYGKTVEIGSGLDAQRPRDRQSAGRARRRRRREDCRQRA